MFLLFQVFLVIPRLPVKVSLVKGLLPPVQTSLEQLSPVRPCLAQPKLDRGCLGQPQLARTSLEVSSNNHLYLEPVRM